MTSLVQRGKGDDRIQPIAEFRGKHALDIGHFITRLRPLGKADERFRKRFRPRIGGHDDNHIAEVRLAAIIVGQRSMIHHLQQDIENIRMGLFNFIEQQHRYGCLMMASVSKPP